MTRDEKMSRNPSVFPSPLVIFSFSACCLETVGHSIGNLIEKLYCHKYIILTEIQLLQTVWSLLMNILRQIRPQIITLIHFAPVNNFYQADLNI